MSDLNFSDIPFDDDSCQVSFDETDEGCRNCPNFRICYEEHIDRTQDEEDDDE